MSTAIATSSVDNLVLDITSEIEVQASLDNTFAALLEQLGPAADTPEGNPMPMKLEAWPGGRWYRDLGDGNGHFWGQVQAIKRPTLLELTGPLFMSYAVVNNVQYRLKEVPGGVLIAFHHFALGVVPDEYRQNINKGWSHINQQVKNRAEKPRR